MNVDAIIRCQEYYNMLLFDLYNLRNLLEYPIARYCLDNIDMINRNRLIRRIYVSHSYYLEPSKN
jgi:hypothetical protein